jgi:hypothetical protein
MQIHYLILGRPSCLESSRVNQVFKYQEPKHYFWERSKHVCSLTHIPANREGAKMWTDGGRTSGDVALATEVGTIDHGKRIV